MLAHGEVHVNIPAADLKRARRLFVDKLRLTPVAEDERRRPVRDAVGFLIADVRSALCRPREAHDRPVGRRGPLGGRGSAERGRGELRALRPVRPQVGRRHRRRRRAAGRMVHRQPEQPHVPRRATDLLTPASSPRGDRPSPVPHAPTVSAAVLAHVPGRHLAAIRTQGAGHARAR
jgi:hypothetical protein